MAFTLPGATAGSDAPLLSEVFDIPEFQGDSFVLRLSDSVAGDKLAETIANYVVTDDIAAALDRALTLVGKGLATGDNKGLYLTGSFGSGKSHFMAVLYAMLAGSPLTRAEADLQPIIASHEKTVGANLLQLPFHFLDSTSMEDTIFRGYLDHISALHPESTPPVLHSAEEIFSDAEDFRSTMGDEAFFAKLNQARTKPEASATGASGGSVGGIDFGALGVDAATSGGWGAASFEAARHGQGEAVTRLAAALTETMFRSYATGSQWLGLADGLNRITEHAKSLGYAGVVLYLDELILWLTFMISDRSAFNREAQKLTLLVENSVGTMALPVISIIARQHDLSVWKPTSNEAGEELEARRQAFAHQEGRFTDITLGNQNLPKIANKRLLSPKSGGARLALNRAFDDLQLRPEITNVLLDGVNTSDEHRGSDMEQFRLTYPFSPALVDTLVNLASVMQRERTGLKVMENILIGKRDAMRIDSVIPVGDAFDYIMESNEKGTSDLARRFGLGRKFWEEKLRPFILATYNLDPGTPDEELPPAPSGDVRVGKTLILAALATEVPALKNMTASRLAHLNHGSIVTVFKGDAISRVLANMRKWAAEFPEILIQKDVKDPVISVKLDDVAWEEVLISSQHFDNMGRREQLIKNSLRGSFGIGDASAQADFDGSVRRSLTWKGTPRTVEIKFGNVRDEAELSDSDFPPATDGNLRLIVDLPMDSEPHTISEDHNRVDGLLRKDGAAPFTIVWLPKFLSPDDLAKLGDLVVLNNILTPAGYRDATERYTEDDRAQIRPILDARQSTLRDQLERQLMVVYGAESGASFAEGQEPLKSLDPEVRVSKPIGADMAEAAERLFADAFHQRYPDHPDFGEGPLISTADFAKIVDALRLAATDKNGRADLAPDVRKVCARVLPALGLATVMESHLVFDQDRYRTALTDVDSRLRGDGIDPDGVVSVQGLRNAVKRVNERRGLTDDVIDVYVCAWAAAKNRTWIHHSRQLAEAPAFKNLDALMELHPVELPSQETWEQAIDVYQALFGDRLHDYLTGANLGALLEEVRRQVETHRDTAQGVELALATLRGRLGRTSISQRERLAGELTSLFDKLHADRARPLMVVQHLAEARTARESFLGASEQEVIRALENQAEVLKVAQSFLDEPLSTAVRTLKSNAGTDDAARLILENLATGMGQHEFTSPAQKALQKFQMDHARWVEDKMQPIPVDPPIEPPAPVDPPAEPPMPPAEDRVVLDEVSDFSVIESQVKTMLGGGTRKVRVTIEFLGES